MRARIEAYAQTVRSTIAIARTFGPEDWGRPTECPGWTVKDQLAHIVGVERRLLGDPDPDPAPRDLPHVRNDFGLLMEAAVHARRPVPGDAVLFELGEALERRLAVLPDVDPHQQVICPDGALGPYTRFMGFRALDCWTHEQDIRRAVGRPGNLDAPAAFCLWDILGNGLRNVVVRGARGRPGTLVTFTICGPPSFFRAVRVGADGRGHLASHVSGPATPTTALRMDWETYVRLTTGRCGPDAVRVTVEGDCELADRVLATMALTP